MYDDLGIEDEPLQCARELYRAGQYAGVVAVCTQALELAPMEPALLLERACAWIALWRPDQAYADLHEVLLVEPSCVRAYRVLGQLLLQGGKLAGARDAFRRALSLDPQDEAVRAALEAVDTRLAEVARGKSEAAPRRPSASQLTRPTEPTRAHRHIATSPNGVPISTLTTLIRRAPSAAPAQVSPTHRRQSSEAVPVVRGRDKTAPHRTVLAGRSRAGTAVHAANGPTGSLGSLVRAPTAPIAHVPSAPIPRAITAPHVRLSTQPVVRAATQPSGDLLGLSDSIE